MQANKTKVPTRVGTRYNVLSFKSNLSFFLRSFLRSFFPWSSFFSCFFLCCHVFEFNG